MTAEAEANADPVQPAPQAEPAPEVEPAPLAEDAAPAQPERMVVTVSLPPLRRPAEFLLPRGLEVDVGAQVVVESQGGLRLGRVLTPPHPGGRGRAPRLVRVAHEADHEAQANAQAREELAIRITLRELRDRNLSLKLLTVHMDGVGNRAQVLLAGSGKVDAQDLSSVLGRALDCQVDVRQVGERDEARVLGGCGHCGQPLCCATFLTDYPRASIRHAKEQGVALQAESTSGVCGRTLCCLTYEYDLYRDLRKWLPKPGKRACTTDDREGRVVAVDPLRLTFTLRDAEGRRHVLPASRWDRNVDKELPEPEVTSTRSVAPSGRRAPKDDGLGDLTRGARERTSAGGGRKSRDGGGRRRRPADKKQSDRGGTSTKPRRPSRSKPTQDKAPASADAASKRPRRRRRRRKKTDSPSGENKPS